MYGASRCLVSARASEAMCLASLLAAKSSSSVRTGRAPVNSKLHECALQRPAGGRIIGRNTSITGAPNPGLNPMILDHDHSPARGAQGFDEHLAIDRFRSIGVEQAQPNAVHIALCADVERLISPKLFPGL